MYKKNIQRLTKTFLTLSLTDVASRVQLAGPAQAEAYILNMVNHRTILNCLYEYFLNATHCFRLKMVKFML